MSLLLKKQINKEVNHAGLAGLLEADALDALAAAVQEENRLELVREVLGACQAGEWRWWWSWVHAGWVRGCAGPRSCPPPPFEAPASPPGLQSAT